MELAMIGTVFLMAFLGSWHCGVMCGPLSCNFRESKSFVAYHFGRLVSYLLLGTVLFYGFHFFLDADSRLVKVRASVVFGVLFIVFGLARLNLLGGPRRPVNLRFYRIFYGFIEKNKKFPLVLGLLTGLFPCGWLYSFLMLSTQMKTVTLALLMIFIYWLAALPAFLVFTGFMKNLIQNAPLSHQKISGIVLIMAGVLSIVGHWAEVLRF